MNDKSYRQTRHVPWWKLRLTQQDIASAGLDLRERGPEAEVRHRLYVQNAYATLSPTRELLLRGAQAGLLIGATVLLARLRHWRGAPIDNGGGRVKRLFHAYDAAS